MSKSTSDLEKLAIQAQNGDTDAFGQIFDELADRIHKFIAFRVRDPEEARDITSQVFLDAWQSLKRYDPSRSFSTWIFSIARYKLIDHYRRFRPTASLDVVTDQAGTTDIETETDNKLSAEYVLSAVDQLPELYQTVLKLKLIEEMNYSEIAQITGKTENNLRVIFKRGLEKVRDLL